MKKTSYMICLNCNRVYKLTRTNDGLPCRKCQSKDVVPCYVGVDYSNKKDRTGVRYEWKNKNRLG